VTLANKALQRPGLSLAALPLARAAERRYVGWTAVDMQGSHFCQADKVRSEPDTAHSLDPFWMSLSTTIT
jgi:hypothetical protein